MLQTLNPRRRSARSSSLSLLGYDKYNSCSSVSSYLNREFANCNINFAFKCAINHQRSELIYSIGSLIILMLHTRNCDIAMDRIRYSPKTRVGNWNEELFSEEV